MAAERGSGSSGDWNLIEGEEEPPAAPSPAANRWMRLVQRALRLRFQQRVFGLLGGYLQTYSSAIRDQVKRLF